MTTLTIRQYDALVSAVSSADVEADVRPDYSGRGMYGTLCIGIVAKDTDDLMYRLGSHLAGTTLGSILADQRKSHDDMGLDEIVYFPDLQAPAEVLVECDCDEYDCGCD